MTRDEFMSQAIASGKSKDEIKKVFDSIEAAGEFEESQTSIPQEQVTPEQPEQQTSSISEALLPRSMKAKENKAGIGSRALSTTADILSLPQRALSGLSTGAGYLAGGGSLKDASKEAISDLSKYKSEEKGGLGFAQNMAYDPTLFVPGLGMSKIGKPIVQSGKALTRLGKAVGIGAGQGAASGALQSANGDKNIDVGAIAGTAALGGVLPFAGAGLTKAIRSSLSNALAKGAERNINIEMRGGQTGANLGYNADNALKHGLIGGVSDIAEKSKLKLDELQKQARQLAKESDAKFSISEIFDPIKNGINKQDYPEDFENMVNLVDDLKNKYTIAYGDIVDAPTAMKIRTKIGEKTAFVGRRDAKGVTVDPNADWKEEVYNSVYGSLKNELHNKVGNELKAINQAQSEIIPVRQVALRRMPIAKSNNRLGLMDALAFTGGATAAFGAGDNSDKARNSVLTGLGLALARRGLGSATATKAMYGLSKAIAPKQAVKKI